MPPRVPPTAPLELPVDPDDEDQMYGIEEVWIRQMEEMGEEIDRSQVEFFEELRRRREQGDMDL